MIVVGSQRMLWIRIVGDWLRQRRDRFLLSQANLSASDDEFAGPSSSNLT